MAMLNLDQYFFPVFDRIDPTTAYLGTYNLGWVATSVAIAIVAAFVALSISGRIIAAATPLARFAWTSAGAISMGGGIWSMHFVGMLAFSLPCGITYDPLGTVLSMIPGALASGIALAAISRTDKPGLSRLLVSAVFMGGGIAAMHYAGMAAMRPEALLQYDAGLVAISIVVAVVLAFVSLSIRYQLHRPQTSPIAANVVAASVMGCAIAGMHYTAMQAALFFPLPEAPAYSLAPLSPALLAILITIFTVLIAAATLAASFAGRQSELASILSAEVSRRMCTEVDLRRSEAYLAEAQRLSKTGSFGWKIDTDEVFWSKETHRIMGFDETVKPAIDLVLQRTHPDDRELVQTQIDRAVRGEQRYDYEHRLLMPDGTIKYVHIRAHPQVYEGGEEELVGAVMDITAARQAQDALQSAQADLAHAARVTALGEMGASLAHEVNQPLAAVVSNAEASARWLNRPVPEIEEAIAAVGHILKNAHRASEVIRRTRQFSKKADPEMVQLDINEVVEEAIALVRYEAHRHKVAMRLDLASSLLPVRGDRIQLQQVIVNLVMNGLQATIPIHNRERVLVVHTERRQSGRILVSVEDVGIGIESENADRIFGAFFTTKRDGVGIGLSVCRSIIEAHGGQVWASANAGPGMTFRFTIPVYETAADAA